MANEKRLIDANKMCRELQEEFHGMISDEELKIYQILRRLDEQPTVDAVEVVRCKDCKRYSQSGMCNLYLNVSHEMKPDDFCSYGERREGE